MKTPFRRYDGFAVYPKTASGIVAPTIPAQLKMELVFDIKTGRLRVNCQPEGISILTFLQIVHEAAAVLLLQEIQMQSMLLGHGSILTGTAIGIPGDGQSETESALIKDREESDAEKTQNSD
jgi:hypothetical protein